MLHSILLVSVCFRSHSTRLHQSLPLSLYKDSGDRSVIEKGVGDSNPKALLPLYEALNELGVFQSSMLQVNS